jgi:hypothetical protein
VDTALPPPSTTEVPVAARGSTRRTLLLSGLASALVAAGVTTGVVLTRPNTRKTAASSTSPGQSTPSSSRAPTGPIPVGSWPLDERSGTSATDTAEGRNGTATRVQWGKGPDGAPLFDGVGSEITTQGPVLATGASRSFTVSAWVYLPEIPNSFATAVSQDADTDSVFYLQYSSEDLRWAFSHRGNEVRALSSTAPSTNAWTHLAGVCDGSSGRICLYVNGAPGNTVNDTEPIESTGPLVIGRGKFAGNPADFFLGSIKNVQVFDQSLSPAQIETLR